MSGDNTLITAFQPNRALTRATGDACLVVINGTDLGRKYSLDGDALTIGRANTAQIQIDDEAASRRHAVVEPGAAEVVLRDLGSTNGTLVNERPIREQVLQDGDCIQIGATLLKFLAGNNAEWSYHDEIYRLTTSDPVTHAYNKRYFLQELERELSRCVRHRKDLALVMLDIDHFKAVNDEYGHVAGDHVLRQCAERVLAMIRSEDTFARFGGEEFTLLLPESGRAEAEITAEKVRRAISETPFLCEGAEIPLTMSLGIADLGEYVDVTAGSRPDGTLELDTEAFIRIADERLYQAKKAGRNRVVST
jgi:two-component system, cell cycle response regulator